jgi:SanA protein
MIRKVIKISAYASLFALLLTAFSYGIIEYRAQPYLYTSVDSIPVRKAGLVLGTSPYFGNLYFKNRVEAAATLFFSGKIRCIIVSGDNHVEGYDETTAMKKALAAKGIPDSCIVLDYAGFRTLDSIVRCKEIFGQNDFTIISQEFHNERALFIARKYGINAVAFNATDVSASYGFKTSMRECFARVKCVIDLYILNTQPHFLGERINLPE